VSVTADVAYEFETMLAFLSARLLGAAPDRFDAELESAIARLVSFFDADRGGLALFGPDGSLDVTIVTARKGVPPMAKGRIDLVLPGWANQARLGRGFVMRSAGDIPEDWAAERRFVLAAGMKSHVMLPLRAGETAIGLISLSSVTTERDWSPELLTRFRLFGEILASAIARDRKERELRATLAELFHLKERAEAENVLLREDARNGPGFSEIVGRSHALRHVLHLVEQVAPTGTAVLLTGETGTGKELVARAIHARSARNERPLVAVNCAALPGTLIESELFGYERGAFTGALQRRAGRFEVASGGTIFLDEIGDLPADIQGRLLRVLQEGTFERLGSSHTIKVDVRVVAATNRDLAAAVADGRWRADLFYRLRVFPIEVPPLRDRRDDIPLLVWYFVTRKRAGLGRNVSRITDRAMTALQRYEWPGNVRELENVIERALILSPGETLVLDERSLANPAVAHPESGATRLEEIERAHILRVLSDCGWRISGKGNAAERLGMNRSTLRSRMEKLGIDRPRE